MGRKGWSSYSPWWALHWGGGLVCNIKSGVRLLLCGRYSGRPTREFPVGLPVEAHPGSSTVMRAPGLPPAAVTGPASAFPRCLTYRSFVPICVLFPRGAAESARLAPLQRTSSFGESEPPPRPAFGDVTNQIRLCQLNYHYYYYYLFINLNRPHDFSPL